MEESEKYPWHLLLIGNIDNGKQVKSFYKMEGIGRKGFDMGEKGIIVDNDPLHDIIVKAKSKRGGSKSGIRSKSPNKYKNWDIIKNKKSRGKGSRSPRRKRMVEEEGVMRDFTRFASHLSTSAAAQHIPLRMSQIYEPMPSPVTLITKTKLLEGIRRELLAAVDTFAQTMFIYYTGHSKQSTGDWIFLHGLEVETINIFEILELCYECKYHGEFYLYSDCSYSGGWANSLSKYMKGKHNYSGWFRGFGYFASTRWDMPGIWGDYTTFWTGPPGVRIIKKVIRNQKEEKTQNNTWRRSNPVHIYDKTGRLLALKSNLYNIYLICILVMKS